MKNSAFALNTTPSRFQKWTPKIVLWIHTTWLVFECNGLGSKTAMESVHFSCLRGPFSGPLQNSTPHHCFSHFYPAGPKLDPSEKCWEYCTPVGTGFFFILSKIKNMRLSTLLTPVNTEAKDLWWDTSKIYFLNHWQPFIHKKICRYTSSILCKINFRIICPWSSLWFK